MTFKKNASVSSVDLTDAGVVDITGKSIQKKMEVLPSSRTSKVVVVGGDTEKVIFSFSGEDRKRLFPKL